MKIKVNIILLFSSFTLFGQNQINEIFIDYFGFKGNIQKVEFYDLTKDSLLVREIIFNEKNKITSEVFNDYHYLNTKYKLFGNIKYLYTSKHELPIKSIFNYSNHNPKFEYTRLDTVKTKYKYNKSKQLTELTSYKRNSNTRMKWFAPKYGDGTKNGCTVNPKHTKTRYYWEKIKKYYYSYKNDLLIKANKKNGTYAGGSLIYYKYNENKRTIIIKKHSLYTKNKDLDYIKTFEYSKNKTLVKKESFIQRSGKLQPKLNIITEYNPKQNIETIVTKYKNGKIISRKITEYDKNGNLKRIINTDETNKVIYEYLIRITTKTVANN
jgi:hypothetical protein